MRDRRQHRRRHALEVRQIVHEVVERLRAAIDGVAQHLLQAAFLRLAGEEEDAHLLGPAHIRIALGQHGDGAGDMKAPDAHHDAPLPQRPGDVEGAGKLVGLDADQHHQADIGGPDEGGDPAGIDAGIGFVEAVDLELDILAQALLLGAGLGEPVEHRQGVGRNRRSVPLDDIAIVVVMRGLDEHETEAPAAAEVRRPEGRRAARRIGWAQSRAAAEFSRTRYSPGQLTHRHRQPRKSRRHSKSGQQTAWRERLSVILRLIVAEPTRMILPQAEVAIGVAGRILYFCLHPGAPNCRLGVRPA